jgi:hypothetical protein
VSPLPPQAPDEERNCEYCKQPGASARHSAPAFKGAAQQWEWHHDPCYEMVTTLRMYQQLFNAINAQNLAPIDAALRRVITTKFVGFLAVRIVVETRRPIIESSVKIRLVDRVDSLKGWLTVPISPDIADAIHRGLAVGEGIAPEHSDYVMDVDVSAATKEDIQ